MHLEYLVEGRCRWSCGKDWAASCKICWYGKLRRKIGGFAEGDLLKRARWIGLCIIWRGKSQGNTCLRIKELRASSLWDHMPEWCDTVGGHSLIGVGNEDNSQTIHQGCSNGIECYQWLIARHRRKVCSTKTPYGLHLNAFVVMIGEDEGVDKVRTLSKAVSETGRISRCWNDAT